jgi:hypothetical protein
MTRPFIGLGRASGGTSVLAQLVCLIIGHGRLTIPIVGGYACERCGRKGRR